MNMEEDLAYWDQKQMASCMFQDPSEVSNGSVTVMDQTYVEGQIYDLLLILNS